MRSSRLFIPLSFSKEGDVPRPRSSTSTPSLSPGQAQYVLQRIISDRRVSAGDVSRYVGEMQREISDLEQRLAALRSASGGESGASPGGARRRGRAAATPGREGASGRKRRGAATITPEQLASRQLQGRYLGLIRQIPASKRGQYRKIAQERGREAAIRELQSALKK